MREVAQKPMSFLNITHIRLYQKVSQTALRFMEPLKFDLFENIVLKALLRQILQVLLVSIHASCRRGCHAAADRLFTPIARSGSRPQARITGTSSVSHGQFFAAKGRTCVSGYRTECLATFKSGWRLETHGFIVGEIGLGGWLRERRLLLA